MWNLYYWTQVSRHGTGRSSLIIETLIAASSAVTTIVTVSCTDINTLVDRAKVYPDLSVEERQEIIDLYYEFGDKYGLDCRDANADWRNGYSQHPTTLGENKWHKSLTEVLSMTPMTEKILYSQHHNLLTEV